MFVTRRVYVKNQANSQPETGHATVCVTRRGHIKTRPTHKLKQSRPQSVTKRVHIRNQANSLAEIRQATACVTRRVHIKSQANLLPETRQATVCVTRRVHIKNQANSPSEVRQGKVSVKERPEHVSLDEHIVKGVLTHLLKKMARACVSGVCKIKCKKAYLLKKVKAHYTL